MELTVCVTTVKSGDDGGGGGGVGSDVDDLLH